MPAEMSWVQSAWTWARANDIPNWIAMAISAIVWPAIVILWQRRRVNGVRGLEVHFVGGSITIDGNPHAAVDIRFMNHTGSVVYISGVRIRGCTKSFHVPTDAARDIAANSYHLKFMDDGNAFRLREITLQTNETRKTCMPASSLPAGFLNYSPPFWRRLFRCQKYLVLEYTAMVGNARHFVSTRY